MATPLWRPCPGGGIPLRAIRTPPIPPPSPHRSRSFVLFVFHLLCIVIACCGGGGGLGKTRGATLPRVAAEATAANSFRVGAVNKVVGRHCRPIVDVPRRRRHQELDALRGGSPAPCASSSSDRSCRLAAPFAYVGGPPVPPHGLAARLSLLRATAKATTSRHNIVDALLFRSQPRRPSVAVTTLSAMAVTIRIVGRSRGTGSAKSSSPSSSSTSWIEDGCAMYQKRLLGTPIELATAWSRSDDELVKAVRGDESKGHAVVLLDPKGTPITSETFAAKMDEWLQKGGSRLTFVIGGAHGLPKELLLGRGGAGTGNKGGGNKGGGTAATPKPTQIRLSDLTFTHQMARLLLVEQIYRASEIRRGSGYHK